MLSDEVRREKAHRHFVTTFGEERGTKMWEEYCQKSGLLPKGKKKPPKPKKEKTDD